MNASSSPAPRVVVSIRRAHWRRLPAPPGLSVMFGPEDTDGHVPVIGIVLRAPDKPGWVWCVAAQGTHLAARVETEEDAKAHVEMALDSQGLL